MCRILVSKLCVSTALLINKMRNELNKKLKKIKNKKKIVLGG